MSKVFKSLAVSLATVSLLALYPAGKALAATKPGWNEIDGKWYYYESDGKTVHTGWLSSGSKWYYFDADGVMLSSQMAVVNGSAYWFEKSGAMAVNKWVKMYDYGEFDDGKLYSAYSYFGSNGKNCTGWKKISGNWYYFEGMYPATDVAFGTREIDGKVYVFKHGGILASAEWVDSPFLDDNGKLYRYYANSSGVASVGWKQINKKWYYFDKSGHMVYGKMKIDDSIYIFADNGIMQTGWYKDPDTGKWCYLKKSGALAVSEWITDGGKKYYFDSKSYMVTGIVTINNVKYWFADSGAVKTGWQKDDSGRWYYLKKDGSFTISDWLTEGNKKYYFNSKGIMVTGKVKIGDNTYWFADSGAMMTGWFQNASGYWFYLQKDGVLALNGWFTIDGKTYSFDANGALRTGIRTIDGKTYFLGDDGALRHKGWQQDFKGYWYYVKDDDTLAKSEWICLSSKWYYLRSNGTMMSNGKMTINGVVYTFDANGVCTNHP